jgi:anti-sigma B factor antagonist
MTGHDALDRSTRGIPLDGEPLSIGYGYPDDGITVVSLVGDCDLASAASLRRALRYVVEDSPDLLVLDLTESTFFDSTSLRALLDADRKRRRKGREGIVLVVNDLARRVLEISGTDPVFTIHASLDAALAERDENRPYVRRMDPPRIHEALSSRLRNVVSRRPVVDERVDP